MVVLRAVALLLSFAFAGCSGTGSTAEEPSEAIGASDPAGQEADAPGPAASQSPSSAAPSASASKRAAAAPPSSRPVVGTCEVGAAYAVTVEGDVAFANEITIYCETPVLRSPSGAGFRSGLVEVDWSQVGPAPPRLDLQASIDGTQVAALSGESSPLAATVAPDAMPAGDGFEVRIDWGGQGVFVDFSARVSVSLFELDAVPPGYTALA